MGIFILAGLLLIAFAAYRVYAYKKQRQIEEMAADAHAYVSAEIVEILQNLKALVIQNGGVMSPEIKQIQDQVHHQLENLTCHTDSEASVREYLSAAKQDLALLQVKLNQLKTGEPLNSHHQSNQPHQTHTNSIADEFDALK